MHSVKIQSARTLANVISVIPATVKIVLMLMSVQLTCMIAMLTPLVSIMTVLLLVLAQKEQKVMEQTAKTSMNVPVQHMIVLSMLVVPIQSTVTVVLVWPVTKATVLLVMM